MGDTIPSDEEMEDTLAQKVNEGVLDDTLRNEDYLVVEGVEKLKDGV